MRTFTKSRKTLLTVALLLTTLTMLWWVAVPNGLAPASFLLIGLLMAGLVIIGRLNYDNSQDTGSLAQMLHETERAPAIARPAPRATPGQGRRS
jgi:hypothetical protein